MNVSGQADVMEVAVMGPTSIAGEWVTPRQRSLVAVLALYGDDGACIDVLSDGVWGPHPPASARSSLQNQMTRLRRAFGSDLIRCTQGRYRLGAKTDTRRFEGLVSPRLACPPATVSIPDLETGLALWRGTPFHDVTDHHRADVERARLDQLRGEAVEHLAIARIASGQFAEAIAELVAHAERDPYRERIWELLLVALHLAGRRTEALAAHDRYVARLSADLSAAPSAALLHLSAVIANGGELDLANHVEELSGEGEHSPPTARANDHAVRPATSRVRCGRVSGSGHRRWFIG